MSKAKHNVLMRFDPEVHKILADICDAENRSMSNTIHTLIQYALATYDIKSIHAKDSVKPNNVPVSNTPITTAQSSMIWIWTN